MYKMSVTKMYVIKLIYLRNRYHFRTISNGCMQILKNFPSIPIAENDTIMNGVHAIWINRNICIATHQ